MTFLLGFLHLAEPGGLAAVSLRAMNPGASQMSTQELGMTLEDMPQLRFMSWCNAFRR
jgi:hypothetical protein